MKRHQVIPKDIRCLLPVEQIITHAERAQRRARLVSWLIAGWVSAGVLLVSLIVVCGMR